MCVITHKIIGLAGVVTGICLVLAGCSASTEPPSDRAGRGPAAGGTIAATGGTGSGGTGGGTGGQIATGGVKGLGGTGGGSADKIRDRACASEPYAAQQSPLTIYTLFDDSGSMIPWWAQVTSAFIQFSKDPESAGINLGIKFFGQNCDAGFYATPDIAIDTLPNHAMAIESNLGLHFPISGTATTPALEGALMAAQARKSAFPEETVIILLVTDGAPSNCGADLNNASAAATAAANAGIPVYVLGLGNIQGMNTLSMAGGTGDAIVADPSNPDLVVAAMNEIRGRALPCDYAVPEGGANMRGYINLVYDDGMGQTGTIPSVPSAGECDEQRGGWYFNGSGDRLNVCPSTCNALKSGLATQVDVVLGCPTEELM